MNGSSVFSPCLTQGVHPTIRVNPCLSVAHFHPLWPAPSPGAVVESQIWPIDTNPYVIPPADPKPSIRLSGFWHQKTTVPASVFGLCGLSVSAVNLNSLSTRFGTTPEVNADRHTHASLSAYLQITDSKLKKKDTLAFLSLAGFWSRPLFYE